MSIFTYSNLYRAYLDCRKTKRKTINALKFEIDLERNLQLLLSELRNKEYRPGRSICFVVTNPVPREIFAAEFRDRIVHHLLIREILPIGERHFIFDSYACRKNKGTHQAINRLKKFMRQITNNGNKNAFYFQLDIKGFFMSIDQQILYNLIKKLISKENRPEDWEEDVLWLAKIIIFHNPAENYIIKGNPALFSLIPAHKSLRCQSKGRGLPIGNYTSQFFANLYLNELDQFSKRKLRSRYYLRYVDDFILLDIDKEKLKYAKNKIDDFIRGKLKLELNANKIRLQFLAKGIDFLGYFSKLNYILVRQRVVKRLKNNLFKINSADVKILNKKMFLKRNLAMINSYYGHFCHGQSFNLRKNIYNNYLAKLRNFFSAKKGFICLKMNNKEQLFLISC